MFSRLCHRPAAPGALPGYDLHIAILPLDLFRPDHSDRLLAPHAPRLIAGQALAFLAHKLLTRPAGKLCADNPDMPVIVNMARTPSRDIALVDRLDIAANLLRYLRWLVLHPQQAPQAVDLLARHAWAWPVGGHPLAL